MHLDKKREEQLEKMEFELEKEYNQEQIEEQKSSEMTVEIESEKEKVEEAEQVEAEVEKHQSVEDLAKKRKRDLIFELSLFFILGILIGITIKTEAVKKITIGFNDYQIPVKVDRYDVSQLKRNLLQQAAIEQAAQEQLSDEDQARKAQ
ncbi:MAG: hypothetical protein HGA61_00950 [Candidatus Moranbacteria bacterium]|nr:hypothetical protein [Candidatus Moranbacteria bacterium]